MQSAAIIPEPEKCNQCGTPVSFLEVQKYGLRQLGGGIRCIECVGIFEAAERALNQRLTATYLPDTGKTTIKCQGWCNRTLEEIWKEDRTHSMFVVTKDGERQMLCPSCSNRYSGMEAGGLYRGTVFAAKGSVFSPYERMKAAVDRFIQRGGRLIGR